MTIGQSSQDCKPFVLIRGLSRRFSINQKRTKHATAAASSDRVPASDHPRSPPRFTPMLIQISAAERAAAPGQSILPGVAALDSGTYAIDKTIATRPTIRMKRKIERNPQ